MSKSKFDLSVLNPEQLKAVRQTDGPCMIIAGAGSGKTRVLTYKIAYLIETGVNPHSILALTFTNKAAGEMKERIKMLVKSTYDVIWMGTFHSLFSRILRFEADKIGFTRNYTIYDNDDSISLVKKIIKSNEIPKDSTNPEAVYAKISKLKNKFIKPEEYSKSAVKTDEKKVSIVYNEYQKMLKINNAMDFDDLLLHPIDLFANYKNILKKYQERFRYILVDEYQDTNKAQYIIINMLASEHRNITVVGDDAQSIYRWRGAELDNIFDFIEDYPEHRMFKLEQNYRSTKKILSLADEIIKSNERRINKNLWTKNKEGEYIILTETLSDKEEALFICRKIKEEIRNNKLNYKDFAVLYRTNAQSRVIEEIFMKEGMPHTIVGGIRFYQRKEIKDIISYLKIIVNPKDNEAILRVLGVEEGIGKTTIGKLAEISGSENISIMDVIEKIETYDNFNSGTKSLLLALLAFVNKYHNIRNDLHIVEFVKGMIDEIGIILRLKYEDTAESKERIDNIYELINAVADYAGKNENPTIEGFLETVSLISDIDEVDSKKNAVTLMTCHSAKGLEFPVVFVTGLEDGLFPVLNSLEDIESLEEERRLFYVAVTRAKEKLYLSFCNERYRFGTKLYQAKSRFLREISETIYESSIIKNNLVNQSLKRTGNGTKSIHHNRRSYIKIEPSSEKKKKIIYEFIEDDAFSDIKPGVDIYHNTYGNGRILNVTGKGSEKRAEIYFENAGIKKIILKYAKMRVRINEN